MAGRSCRSPCSRSRPSFRPFALGIGGLAAGIIAVRTQSLLLPMAVHIGLDIPIYYAFA